MSSNNADVGKVFNIMSGSGGGDGPVRLEGLAVTKPPLKTIYKSGEAFDPTGMVVTATYAFGLTSDVTGYTVSPQVLTDGVSEVTITYTEGRITKTASVAVTVEKVLTSIEVTTPPQKTNYNYLEKFDPYGMVVTAKFSDGSNAVAVGYTYPTTEFTTLGSQPINISYTYEEVTKDTTLSVTVNAISVPIPTQKEIPAYNGQEQTPVWDNYDSVKMAISGETSGLNAKDNYSVTFTLNYGYVFPDGQNEATVKWAISRAIIEALPKQVDVPAADGRVKTPSWDGYDPEKMTIGGDRSGTVAGDYSVTFTPTANYQWWDHTTGPKTVVWKIASIIVSVPTQKNIPIYDGSPKTPEWDNFDTDHSTVQVTSATDAGDHNATFTLLEGMWEDGGTEPKVIKWRINRASISAVPQQAGSLVYDGDPKTPNWDANYDTKKMTLSVESKVNAGTDYPASFTPTSNYQWWDGSIEAKTATWAIEKASYTPTATPASVTLNMTAKNSSFVVNRKGDGTITATSDNTKVATIGTINQNSGEVPVNSVNETSGSATITVKIAESANYKDAEFKVNVTASFREYLYGYDLTIADTNPATRVSYPSDVENSAFTAAKMNFGTSFSYGSWPSTPGQKFMPRPCMLLNSGAVDYYLNPNDYAQKAEGGTSDVANVGYAGNAMMEWPKIYVKRWESGGVYHFRCSDVKVDEDYECWSNYDKNNKEIPHFYTPIYFGSKDSSGKLRSISGQANWVSTGGAQPEIDAAKLNGSDIWYTEVVADRFLLQDLLVMMFKSTDLQTALGNGVCSASAAIAPGTMNTRGLFWGASDKTSGVKAFGMENPWGNLWRRTAGWINANGTQKVKLTRGTKDGSQAADYNTTGDGYLTVAGATPSGSSGGYISSCVTQKYGRVPVVVSGSSTTNECDGMWFNNGQVDYASVGGGWGDGLAVGPFAVGLSRLASYSYANRGAALSCKPLAAA